MDKNIYKIGIDARLWNETGVGRYIRNLVWELAKIDTKNEYILFLKENEFKNVELPGKNFRKVLADIHWHSLKEQRVLSGILNKENLDLMHFPYFSVPINYAKSFVMTIHDLIINTYPTGKASTKNPLLYWLKFYAYTFILRLAIFHAKKVIAVSYSTKKEILKQYKVNEKKIVVTYEGVDEKIQTTSNKQQIISQKYFLYVGNAYPHKNLERLIEAFSQIENMKLILVGKEDFFYRKLKEHVRKRALDSQILFYEKVSDAGLAALYKNAHAVIAPSLMEGFGLPLLEAMAYGTIVVASDIPVFREIGKESPIYFDPTNTISIEKALREVALDKVMNIAQRKEDGKKRAKEFSWKKMAQQTVEIYESCISIR